MVTEETSDAYWSVTMLASTAESTSSSSGMADTEARRSLSAAGSEEKAPAPGGARASDAS
ncbi:hypothetical protein EYF80_024861 [Liparis tanakae]|uniref:Uncharacterized protein n=1 Tax=Liparis tanakae TaxID=230148 RepID=A0A4Z2HGJ3_9TELE|nr:hypothetical protein EYF80_024861 [Liparis tanakae]